MVTHLLHGLWLRDSGLHLWIEQVDGHKVVIPEGVPRGTFPPLVEAILRDKQFRNLVRMKLQTPRGKLVDLSIPTAVYTPEQAVSILGQFAVFDGISPAATKRQRETLAPDLMWLVRLYRGLEQYVRAGRVMLRLRWFDGEWWPQWQLAEGRGERTWIASMTSALPGVLALNSGTGIAEDMAEELPHWIANLLLQELLDAPRHGPWHEFSRTLLRSEPLRNGSAKLANAINIWKRSISHVPTELVVVVESAVVDEQLGEDIWSIRVRARVGVGSPIAVNPLEFDPEVFTQLREAYDHLCLISKIIRNDRLQLQHLGERATSTLTLLGASQTDVAGDWDVHLTTDELLEFLSDDVPRLRAAGFLVMLPKSWAKHSVDAGLHMESNADPTLASTKVKVGLEQVVDFNWRMSLGGVELTNAEMQQLIASKAGLVKLRGEWVMADSDSLRHVTRYMEELSKTARSRLQQELDELTAQLEMARKLGRTDIEQIEQELEEIQRQFDNQYALFGEVTLAELRELAIAHSETLPMDYTGSQWHLALTGGLEEEAVLPAPRRMMIPQGVRAELREYQRRGVDWLYWMSSQNLGAILADDMGLGKTLQVLTLIAIEKEYGNERPVLIVCPTSVVGNWANEAARFTPNLRVVVHYGPQRAKDEACIRQADQADVVITSYGVLTREFETLGKVDWEHVVLDEAQHIKNSSTRAARCARSLPARQRIALTGTPIENRLSELRSIMDFCNPGILGSASFFRNHFAKAIEREEDEYMAARLKQLTAPFILRRLKTDPKIIDDLPDKNEHIIRVHLTAEQAALYKALVDDIEGQLASKEDIERKGHVLATITRIKQICNHPAHFLGDDSSLVMRGQHRSGKVEELVRILDAALERHERVLVFTQYRAFGLLLQKYLSDRFGQDIPFLHGQVPQAGRQRMIANFHEPDGASIMLVSLRAGGTGVNLTAANVVVHMDRWWNPAVENQATDRAYRIGQRKDVRVYKMVSVGTLEESIQDILEGKLRLAGQVIGQGEGWITELSPTELAQLMSYRGRGAK
ncbi:MAG: DEAD/DEAH box helicase [Corynebacterium sp.]|nr:DEAD/DEAH box helicase [Corynebacterium sp.]